MVGFVSFILTMIGFVIIVQNMGWTINTNTHSLLGLVYSGLSLAITLSGSYAVYLMQYGDININTPSLIKKVDMHKAFGYFMIFSVQITVTTGMLTQGTKGMIVAAANAVLFVTFIGLQEMKRRSILASYVPFKTDLPIMTNDEF